MNDPGSTSLSLGEARVAGAGLSERTFTFEADGGTVPGLLWTPAGSAGAKPGTPRPLVLAGHGFGVDKRYPFPTPALHSLVRDAGCAVAILDAPEHGDRRKDPTAGFEEVASAYQEYWRTFAGSRIAREYALAARLLRAEPEIGAGPIGYWGLSLATQYGLAYLAERARSPDEEVRAAVLGLFRHGPVVAHYAGRLRCPVFFVQQLEDEIHPAETVSALFDELASPVKELAASAGAHVDVPDDVIQRAVRFMRHHLGID